MAWQREGGWRNRWRWISLPNYGKTKDSAKRKLQLCMNSIFFLSDMNPTGRYARSPNRAFRRLELIELDPYTDTSPALRVHLRSASPPSRRARASHRSTRMAVELPEKYPWASAPGEYLPCAIAHPVLSSD